MLGHPDVPGPFVVVAFSQLTFVRRLRALAMVPSSRCVRLRGFPIYPCNLHYKRGSDAKRAIHPSRFFQLLHLVQYVVMVLAQFPSRRPDLPDV